MNGHQGEEFFSALDAYRARFGPGHSPDFWGMEDEFYPAAAAAMREAIDRGRPWTHDEWWQRVFGRAPPEYPPDALL